jgi:hypothetical protein
VLAASRLPSSPFDKLRVRTTGFLFGMAFLAASSSEPGLSIGLEKGLAEGGEAKVFEGRRPHRSRGAVTRTET